MASFWRKPWVNLWKNLSFSTYSIFCFYSLKIVQHIFLAYISEKKNMEKSPFFDQNHGLTPLKKISLFLLFKLLVFIA